MSNTYNPGDVVIDPAPLNQSLWWLGIVRGVLAILFGIFALIWPEATVVIVTVIFAIYAIVDGIVNIAAAIATRKTESTWGWLLTQGILTVIAGLLALFAPLYAAGFVVLFVLWIIAIWAVIGGIFGIPAAASAGMTGGAKAAGIILAILSLILGIVLIYLLVTNPSGAVGGFVWVVAVWAIAVGIVMIIASIAGRVTGGPRAAMP